MRAFAVPEFNGTGSVIVVPGSRARRGPDLVRVRAAGVNPMDPFVVSGVMKDMLPTACPWCPASTTPATSRRSVRASKPCASGDDVFGPVGKMVFGEGSWAEFVTVNAALAEPDSETASIRSWLRRCPPRAAGRSLWSTPSMRRKATRS